MKKIVALLLAACMVFALCACGGSSAPAAAPAAPAANDTAAAPAAAAEPIEFSYCVHTANGLHEQTMQHFVDKLTELVGAENVKVTSYTPGTMGKETELSQAVIFGDLTMSIPSDSLNTANMGLDDWTALPGLITSREQAFELMLNADAPLSQLLDQEYAENGVIRLGGIDNGFRCIATNEDMTTVEGMQAVKTRVANVWTMVDLYNNAGVQATIIDSSEVISSLQQGTIAAVENGLVNLSEQGYADLLDQVLAVNFIYATRSFICNADWFNSLSESNQAAVREAARYAVDWTNEEFGNKYEELLTDPRWTVHDLTDEQYEVFAAAADKVLEKAYETYDTAILDQVVAACGK